MSAKRRLRVAPIGVFTAEFFARVGLVALWQPEDRSLAERIERSAAFLALAASLLRRVPVSTSDEAGVMGDE